jgi:hypothetical protein
MLATVLCTCASGLLSKWRIQLGLQRQLSYCVIMIAFSNELSSKIKQRPQGGREECASAIEIHLHDVVEMTLSGTPLEKHIEHDGCDKHDEQS